MAIHGHDIGSDVRQVGLDGRPRVEVSPGSDGRIRFRPAPILGERWITVGVFGL
jgi:hypothetical protein